MSERRQLNAIVAELDQAIGSKLLELDQTAREVLGKRLALGERDCADIYAAGRHQRVDRSLACDVILAKQTSSLCEGSMVCRPAILRHFGHILAVRVV